MAKKSIALFALFVLVLPMRAADDPTEKDPPEFVFARLVYSSGGMGNFFGGGGSWATDYPEADYKFMSWIKRLTGIKVKEEENPVRILDRDLFSYPYVYAVEVGRMNLSAPEAATLREY